MTRTARYTAEQARDIGSCAVIAIAEVTGLTWDQVWEVAQYYFTRSGLSPVHKYQILKELGFRSDGFFKLIHMARLRDVFDKRPTAMTVVQAEQWLIQNMPEAKLICSIMVDGQAHAIAFNNGRFHNTLGAKRSRINYASIITR